MSYSGYVGKAPATKSIPKRKITTGPSHCTAHVAADRTASKLNGGSAEYKNNPTPRIIRAIPTIKAVPATCVPAFFAIIFSLLMSASRNCIAIIPVTDGQVNIIGGMKIVYLCIAFIKPRTTIRHGARSSLDDVHHLLKEFSMRAIIAQMVLIDLKMRPLQPGPRKKPFWDGSRSGAAFASVGAGGVKVSRAALDVNIHTGRGTTLSYTPLKLGELRLELVADCFDFGRANVCHSEY